MLEGFVAGADGSETWEWEPFATDITGAPGAAGEELQKPRPSAGPTPGSTSQS